MVEITPEKEKGKARYAIWFAVALFFLLFTSSYEVWTAWIDHFVTPDFRQVVWALNLVYVFGMFGCGVLLVSNPWWMRLLVELAVLTTALLAGMLLYRVFPFDFARFGATAAGLAHGALFVVLLMLGVGIFVTLVRLASGTRWPRHGVAP